MLRRGLSRLSGSNPHAFHFTPGASEAHWHLAALSTATARSNPLLAHLHRFRTLQKKGVSMGSSSSVSIDSTSRELSKINAKLNRRKKDQEHKLQQRATGDQKSPAAPQQRQQSAIADSDVELATQQSTAVARKKLLSSLGLEDLMVLSSPAPPVQQQSQKHTDDSALLVELRSEVAAVLRVAPPQLTVSMIARCLRTAPSSAAEQEGHRATLSTELLEGNTSALVEIVARAIFSHRRLVRRVASDASAASPARESDETLEVDEHNAESGASPSPPAAAAAAAATSAPVDAKLMLLSGVAQYRYLTKSVIHPSLRNQLANSRGKSGTNGGDVSSAASDSLIDLHLQLLASHRDVAGVVELLTVIAECETSEAARPKGEFWFLRSPRDMRALLTAALDELHPSLSRVSHIVAEHPDLARHCIAQLASFVANAADFEMVKSMWVAEVCDNLQFYDPEQQPRMIAATVALYEALSRCGSIEAEAKLEIVSDLHRTFLSNAPLAVCMNGQVLLGMLAAVAAAKDHWKTLATLNQYTTLLSEATGSYDAEAGSDASRARRREQLQLVTGNKKGHKYHAMHGVNLLTAFRHDTDAMLMVHVHQMRLGRRMPLLTSASNVLAFSIVKEAAAVVTQLEDAARINDAAKASAFANNNNNNDDDDTQEAIRRPTSKSVEMVISLMWSHRRLPSHDTYSMLLLQKSLEIRSIVEAHVRAVAAASVATMRGKARLAAPTWVEESVVDPLAACNEVLWRLSAVEHLTLPPVGVAAALQLVLAQLMRLARMQEWAPKLNRVLFDASASSQDKNLARNFDTFESVASEFAARVQRAFEPLLSAIPATQVIRTPTDIGALGAILIVDDGVVELLGRVSEWQRSQPIAAAGAEAPSPRASATDEFLAALRSDCGSSSVVVVFTLQALRYLRTQELILAAERGELSTIPKLFTCGQLKGEAPLPANWRVLDFATSVALIEGNVAKTLRCSSAAARPWSQRFRVITSGAASSSLAVSANDDEWSATFFQLYDLPASSQLDWWTFQRRLHHCRQIPLTAFERFLFTFGNEAVPVSGWARRDFGIIASRERRGSPEFISPAVSRFVDFRFAEEEPTKGSVCWPDVGGVLSSSGF